MAYQDDFRNKVIAALKAKNLAVDISQEATQQAIVEEAQIVAQSESRPMSPEEMKQVLQDVANQLSAENQQFSAQSSDFIAFAPQESNPPGGSYSGGGIAVSVMNKDIMIIPTAGTATSINTLSQIDFKIISNPNAYGVIDPNEVKSSLYNWGERVAGNTYDTPVLGIGGAWNGVSYTPTAQWGTGGSQGSGIAGSIATRTGFGQIIYFKPASSTIYAGLYNDLGINVDYTTRSFTLTGYNAAIPGSLPSSGFAVTFGGIGNSGDLIIQGAVSDAQTNTLKFLSPLTISNFTATDTLILGQSSGTAVSQWFVGGTAQTSNAYNLSAAASAFAVGDLFYSAGVGHTTLARLPIGSNNTYLASTGSTPFWTNTIAANTVSVNPAVNAATLYPLLNNANGSGAAVSTDTDFYVNPGANILYYASGSIYAGLAMSSPTFTSNASLAIKPGADATTAIQLQKANGTSVFNVDTTNNRIGINLTAPAYTLDVSGPVHASSGSSYLINGKVVLNETTLGNSVNSIGTITTGVWAATAITTNYGGTGFQTYVTGDILFAATATSLGRLPAVVSGSVLASNGTGAAPYYATFTSLSVGTAVTAANSYVAANTNAGANYIVFTPSTSSGLSGVGLSITSQASQLQYNPTNQQLIVPNITGTAFTATNLTGTILTASQNNITSATSLASIGTITQGVWNSTAIGTTYGGTGSNLGPGASVGNSNRIIVTGNTGGYAASLIDNATAGNLLVSGGPNAAPTFTNTTAAAFTFSSGALSINNAVITQGTVSTTPTNATDLVNKSYADSLSGGLDPHASVRLTTISAIGGSYRQAGTAGTLSGLGDYIIATTPAELIGVAVGLDTPTSGIALTNGQRVLIKDGVLGGYASGSGAYAAFSTITTYGGFASSYVANGIYTVASYGGAATSGWLLVRATDTDNNGGVQELTGGTFTFVEEGSIYADNGFVCTNDTTILGAIGFGSTQITWSAFSGGASLINGQGISKTGNTVATNFNFTDDGNLVSGITYQGFAIGGARVGGVGFSSRSTFTVTASGANAVATSILTLNTTGFKLQGGQTSRALTVAGTGDQTITYNADGFSHAGGKQLNFAGTQDLTLSSTTAGAGLTVSSSSTLDFRNNTLIISQGTSNITFQSGAASGNTAATVQTLVQNGQTQYNLSTANSTMALGDLYYGGQTGVGWTSMARLQIGSGTGASVLIRNATVPVWGTINLASSDYVSGILALSNGGTNANLTANAGGVVYSTSTALAITGAGTAGSVLVSNNTGAPVWNSITLSSANAVTGILGISNGGTNGSASPTQGGIAYGTGTAYAFTAVGTGGSVLVSNASGAPVWNSITLSSANAVTGILGIANGGTNANSGNFATNGVVIYDGGKLTSGAAVGLTMTGGTGLTVVGTIQATGAIVGSAFNIGGNSLVTSVTPSGGTAIYGGVGISVLNTNNAGALTISGSGQTIIINGPGTGITGTGSATQVTYYNAAREITGNNGFVFSPTANSGAGSGLSLTINSTTGSILAINTQAAMTAGFLIDADINGVQRFGVDWKGMTTLTNNSALGNTALIIQGGRTLLAAPNANYATLNFGNTNANPGAGNTQIGDLWFNGTNLYFRRDASTSFDLLVGSVSGSGLADRIAKWSTGTGLTYSNLSESTAGVGMTLTSNGSIAAGGGTTALLTLQTILTDNSAIDRYFVRGVTSTGTRLFSVDTAGNLRATTKSFDIPHPTKEGMRLVYGVLEGPEHGVYHRGTVEGKGVVQVNLPDYWHKLVGDQYTIQLTPWGNYNVSIGSKTENYFTIQLVGDVISRKFKNIKVDYIIHGSRLDAPLDIEQ